MFYIPYVPQVISVVDHPAGQPQEPLLDGFQMGEIGGVHGGLPWLAFCRVRCTPSTRLVAAGACK